jgi:hypothetical protein
MSTRTQQDDNLEKSHAFQVSRIRNKIAKGKIISPPITGRVYIKRNTFMIPKIELKTPEAVEAWRQEMILKYNL